ncbi:MAG: pilus assembly protein [Kouleothrix sp.]|nr:pilus assembly protein [Kouleothrix sp.]
MLRRARTYGQAIVEFALAATLIFFLLAAVVDIGMMFFALQGLHNAAQEGASYGSRWLLTDSATKKRVLDTATIIDHVRHESGPKGGIGFVNLLDLNGNGIDDSGEPGVITANISTELLLDESEDGDPTRVVSSNAPENIPCDDPSTSTHACYIRVTVRSVHQMIFPFAPAFSRVVPLKSAYIMPIRDSISRGGVGGTPTPPGPAMCIVPDFVGTTVNNASAIWLNANFTGTLTTGAGPANYVIGHQTLTANSSQPCTSSIGVTL